MSHKTAYKSSSVKQTLQHSHSSSKEIKSQEKPASPWDKDPETIEAALSPFWAWRITAH